MKSTETKPDAQLETEQHLFQLLCIIAQTLQRIEAQLSKLTPASLQPNERNKIIHFNGGRRG